MNYLVLLFDKTTCLHLCRKKNYNKTNISQACCLVMTEQRVVERSLKGLKVSESG
jgi:hypothetical protein